MDPITLGLLIAGYAYKKDKDKEKASYELQQQQLEEQRKLEQQEYKNKWGGYYLDGFKLKYQKGTEELKYDLQKQETLKQADKEDAKLTQEEGYLGTEYNSALQQIGLMQEQQAMQNEATALNIAENQGNALAAQGVAGTRGSSVMGALERQEAYNQSAFSQNMQNADKSFNFQVNNAINAKNQNMDNLTYNRGLVNDSRNSWNKGGYNYEAFQLAKLEGANSWNATNSLYDLKKSYNQQYYDLNKMGVWDAASYMFSGLSTGFNTTVKAFNFFQSL